MNTPAASIAIVASVWRLDDADSLTLYKRSAARIITPSIGKRRTSLPSHVARRIRLLASDGADSGSLVLAGHTIPTSIAAPPATSGMPPQARDVRSGWLRTRARPANVVMRAIRIIERRRRCKAVTQLMTPMSLNFDGALACV